MINESQQEQASLYVLGALDDRERQEFEAQLPDSKELRELVRDLQHATVALAGRVPQHQPPTQHWSPASATRTPQLSTTRTSTR